MLREIVARLTTPPQPQPRDPEPGVPGRAMAAARLRAALVAEAAALEWNAAIGEAPRPANRAEVVARADLIRRSRERVERARAERRAAASALDALDGPDGAADRRAFRAVEDRRGDPWAMASNPFCPAAASRPKRGA